MTAASAHVVAVSVAVPRWEEIYGRRTFTSIVRDAVYDPVRFERGGPAGNMTAVHTEDVYAFFAEHYDHWASELGVDRRAWGDCHWGENLMLAGLREESLHIGDRLRIGTAILEVTSPRIPCLKLAWRIGQPEGAVARLIASGLTGCYMRVIAGGVVQASDAVERIAHDPGAITVLNLGRLLFDDSIVDLDILRRTMATPGLGDQASGMLRQRINALADRQSLAVGRWQGWRPFVVTRTQREARATRSFWMTPADGGPIAGYRAGQHLVVRLPDDAGGHVRTWSISDHGGDSHSYRLSIKHEADGSASAWMNETLEPGAALMARPPTGRFTIDRAGVLRIVMISAGIGVTPLVAMLKAHAAGGADAPPLLWLHVARSGADHVLAREVDAILARLPSAERHIYYTRPDPDDVQGRDYDHGGRLDVPRLTALLAQDYALNPFGRTIELPGDQSDFYICGPRRFEEMVRTALADAGVEPGRIRSENFRPAAQPDTATDTPECAQILFARSGRSLRWDRDDGRSLLEVAETAGLTPDSGCRMGSCGSCAVGLIGGKIGYRFAPAADPGPGRILLCCSEPASKAVTLDA